MSSPKATLLVFTAMAAIWSCGATNEKHVYITNDLPSGLVLSFHCLSQDDDMGTMLLAPGGRWGFRFTPRFGANTLFHCGFNWFGAKTTYRFAVYSDNEHRDRCSNCYWSIRFNGTCLTRSSVDLVGCYDWVV